MTDQQGTSYSNEQQLAQAALEHVRKICKGNGLKADSITIASQNISHHSLNAGTYLELKPVTSEKVSPGKIVSGVMVASREAATQQVNQTMMSAANDPTAKAQMADVLLRRPDKGFGLNQQSVPIDFLKREYTWHEACNSCHSTGNTSCTKCHGRKVETCTKCTGRGMMVCPMCRSTGMLQGVKCSRCQGKRFVPCDLCQRSGYMTCRMCHATGLMKCTTCNGVGWKSHILSLQAQAVTYFEYDAKSLPKGAADMFLTHGHTLVPDGKIKVRGRIADDKENALGASYEVDYPYGEIVFTLGKKEVKAAVFGYKADLMEFPNVLDRILQPAMSDLEDAAGNVGDVAAKIKKASRYKIIAQAFLTASKTSTKKTAEFLLKYYDIGLSISMAEKIAVLADSTTAHITKKPRYYGLALGLAITLLVNALYYLAPVRSKIAAYLPDPKFDFVLDIFPLVIGVIITKICIQMSAAAAIKKALGHLFPAGQKSTIAPKARESGIVGYVLCVFITIGMMEVAANTASSAPYWYEIIRNIIAQKFAA